MLPEQLETWAASGIDRTKLNKKGEINNEQLETWAL
jgi:hypothetical protein